MTPLFPLEVLHGAERTLGLGYAVMFGVAFGFILERAGLGRVEKLVGQFYGHDMTVLRVLFTGIVTAMAGAALLSAAGVLDLPAVQLRYPTYLWPMIAGGVALGVGFVVSGYCPGTSVVAAGTGSLDALATLGGLVVGGVAYAELEPALGAFPSSGALGTFTIPQWLGLPLGAVVAGVAALAVGAFAAAGRIERRFASPRPAAPAPAAGASMPSIDDAASIRVAPADPSA